MFSERYGYTSAEKLFQREMGSEELKTQLWNILKVSLWDLQGTVSDRNGDIDILVKRLWFHYFNKDLDHLPEFRYYGDGAYDEIKRQFFGCRWYEVYNFLEFIANDTTKLLKQEVLDWINSTLEKFNSAYRFVDSNIVE